MNGKKPTSFKSLDAEISEMRKSILIKAAIKVIQKNGIREATLRQIANEAQVTTGAIYHYFKNQQHVLAAVYVDAMSEMENILRDIDAGIESDRPNERINALVESYLSYLMEFTWIPDIIVHNEFAEGFDEESRKKIDEANTHFIEEFCRLLMSAGPRRDDQARKTAEAIWAMCAGLVGLFRLSSVNEKDSTRERILDLAEHGVSLLARALEN